MVLYVDTDSVRVSRMHIAAMVQESPLKYTREGSYHIFIFPAPRTENQANQQYHFKSFLWRIELLDTDSCRGTVPMEPPMSNSSMRHRELLK